MPSRTSQIIVRIKGGVRAALEARAVARGLEEVADGADDVKTSAIAAALAMDYLGRAQRRVARANLRIGATSVPAVGGLALMVATATPLAFVILPALAVALWQVTAAAAVWTGALLGGIVGVGAAVGLMAASTIARFRRMKDVVGSAAYDLGNQLWLLKETFLEVTSAGADRLMSGLAAGAQALLPLVRSLREEFTAIGDALGNFFRSLGIRLAGLAPEISAMLAQVPAAVDALALFAGDALAMFVQLATVGAPVLVSALRTVAGWMRDLAEWFTPAQVEAATATLRSFFAGLKAFWSDFTAPISAVIGPAIDEAGAHLANWGGPLGTIVAALIQIGRILLPPTAAFLEAIAGGLDGLDFGRLDVRAIGAAIVAVGKSAVQWFGDMLDALKPAEPFLENVLIPLFSGVLSAIESLPGIVGVFASALGWLGAKAEPLKPLFRFAGEVIGIVFGGAILKVLGAIARAIPIIGRFAGPVLTGLGKAWDWVGGKVRWFLDKIVPRIGGWAGVVARVVTSIVGRLAGLVAWIGGLPGMIADAASGLWDGLKSGLQAVINWITNKLDWIGRKIQSIVDKVNGLAADGGGGFDPLGAMNDLVGGVTRGVRGRAIGGLTQAGEVTLVGERGPELARFPTGTRIHPANVTRGLLQPRALPMREASKSSESKEGSPQFLAPVEVVLQVGARELARTVRHVEINLESRA